MCQMIQGTRDSDAVETTYSGVKLHSERHVGSYKVIIAAKCARKLLLVCLGRLRLEAQNRFDVLLPVLHREVRPRGSFSINDAHCMGYGYSGAHHSFRRAAVSKVHPSFAGFFARYSSNLPILSSSSRSTSSRG